MTTIFPVGKIPLERRLFWSDDVAAAVDEVNGDIHTLVGDKVVIFDAYSILADGKGMTRSEYSADELHINRSGYKALNNELAAMLKVWDND